MLDAVSLNAERATLLPRMSGLNVGAAVLSGDKQSARVAAEDSGSHSLSSI
jgi:hypothetical protein